MRNLKRDQLFSNKCVLAGGGGRDGGEGFFWPLLYARFPPPQRRQVPAHISPAQSPALSGMGCLVGELTVTRIAPHVCRGGATGQERVRGPSSQPDGYQQDHHVPSPRNSLEGGLVGAHGKLVHPSTKPFLPPFPFILPDHMASASCPVTSMTGSTSRRNGSILVALHAV